MHRLTLLIGALLVLTACPRDRNELAQDTIPRDTMPQDTVDLSTLGANLPPEAVDTPAPPGSDRPAPTPIPQAPEALMESVRREASSSQFCFTEHGQKRDPSLRGALTMIVTVGSSGVTNARVGARNWAGSREAGRQVERCLVERAQRAWTVTPGSVRPGQYQVPLRFSGG